MTAGAAREDPVVEAVEVRVGLGRHDLDQVRARRRHAQRVAVVGAHLVDAAVLDDRHRPPRVPPIAPVGRPPPRALASVTMSGVDAEALDRAAGGDAEAGLDLVEDQDDAVPARDLAHRLEVAGLGEHDPEVHHRRLHDHAGRLAALLVELGDAPLHRARRR